MSERNTVPWICAQLGSREHYAMPRVLHASGKLRALLTDYWSSPRGGVTALAPGRDASKAALRFHPGLATATVEHLGARRLIFEIAARLRRLPAWETIMRRNRLFQNAMVRRLRSPAFRDLRERPGVFFGYSYASLDLARALKAMGWKIVLGQIDPGIEEENLVAAEHASHSALGSSWSRAPAEYWRLWREECALSDRIVVNSPWSQDALARAGIKREKIRVVPLAFESGVTGGTPKAYPECFTEARPLRVLFLGQLNLRKGAHLALEAARLFRNKPVEWNFTGPADFPPPPELLDAGTVRWSGPVSRADTARLYREADLFLLPTLSDGFALTQLEAQAASLPVYASRSCGAVVRDGINGRIIDPLTAQQIAVLIEHALEHPRELERMAVQSRVDQAFSLESLRKNLAQLEQELFDS